MRFVRRAAILIALCYLGACAVHAISSASPAELKAVCTNIFTAAEPMLDDAPQAIASAARGMLDRCEAVNREAA